LSNNDCKNKYYTGECFASNVNANDTLKGKNLPKSSKKERGKGGMPSYCAPTQSTKNKAIFSSDKTPNLDKRLVLEKSKVAQTSKNKKSTNVDLHRNNKGVLPQMVIHNPEKQSDPHSHFKTKTTDFASDVGGFTKMSDVFSDNYEGSFIDEDGLSTINEEEEGSFASNVSGFTKISDVFSDNYERSFIDEDGLSTIDEEEESSTTIDEEEESASSKNKRIFRDFENPSIENLNTAPQASSTIPFSSNRKQEFFGGSNLDLRNNFSSNKPRKIDSVSNLDRPRWQGVNSDGRKQEFFGGSNLDLRNNFFPNKPRKIDSVSNLNRPRWQ
jgi:hypothetical protein